MFVVVGATLAVIQVASHHGFVAAAKANIQRAFGSDVHPVSFSIQIVAACVGLECVRVKLRHSFTLWYAALMVLSICALYLTFSRTGWIMAMFVVGYSVVSLGRWPTRALVLGIFVPLMLAGVSHSGRFSDLGSFGYFWENFDPNSSVFDYRFVDNSFSWRIVNWRYGFEQALQQPYFGFGPGQSAYSSYFNLEMHNIFLEAFYEGGVLGFTAFLIVVFGFFRIHRTLPAGNPCDRYARSLANGFGMALFFAVSFSTSFVDQLMSYMLYLLVLAVAYVPASTHRFRA